MESLDDMMLSTVSADHADTAQVFFAQGGQVSKFPSVPSLLVPELSANDDGMDDLKGHEDNDDKAQGAIEI